MAWTFEATERGYAKMWSTATLKGGADAANAETFANKIIAAETRYRAVQASTGVPWYFIGALHMRESSCNFAGVLHNGDRIIGTGGLTVRVPAGRGPFATWEASAVDALKLKDMHRVQAWSVARMLFQAEVFNGLGYVGRGVNSPYVWAGTDHEQRGKYVADRVWDSDAEDTQLGVAAVLIRLAQKRPDIHADLYPTEKPVTEVTNEQILKAIEGLPVAIANALRGIVPTAPAVEPEILPPVAPPVTTPTTTPVLERPSVAISLLTAALGGILQMYGIPVVGEGATGAASALPAVALGSAAVGLSGAGGSLAKVLATALPILLQALPKPEAPKK